MSGPTFELSRTRRLWNASAALRGCLNWKALDRAEGTEDTAVPGFRTKHGVAGSAFVEVDTGVHRHGLFT